MCVSIYKTHMKTRHVYKEHLYFDVLVGLPQSEGRKTLYKIIASWRKHLHVLDACERLINI